MEKCGQWIKRYDGKGFSYKVGNRIYIDIHKGFAGRDWIVYLPDCRDEFKRYGECGIRVVPAYSLRFVTNGLKFGKFLCEIFHEIWIKYGPGYLRNLMKGKPAINIDIESFLNSFQREGYIK